MASFGLYFRGVSQEEANAIRLQANKVAAYHGYSAERGPTAGAGNAAEMLVAIASGELATVLLPDEQRSMAIRWLDEQSNKVDNFSLAEALQSIAKQLDAAVQREYEAEQEELRSYLDEE
jgi:hypothetical protein